MPDLRRMVRYYEAAGPDYEAWSPAFNMHFGYWRTGINPFDREAMLEEMNRQIARRLGGAGSFLDMGCGLGATARALLKHLPGSKIKGVTLVPWQVQQARRLTTDAQSIEFVEADYRNTAFPSASFDGVYAVESLCHGPGRDKADCLSEASRLLRPGGVLVVADGFLKHGRPLKGWVDACHRRICNCWSMDSLAVLPEFVEKLRDLGFGEISIREVSWRVAPSVAHVPFVTLRFLAKKLLLERTSLSRERWNNILAPILTGVVGLARDHFGYFFVEGRKSLKNQPRVCMGESE